jgi:hypothetical protein
MHRFPAFLTVELSTEQNQTAQFIITQNRLHPVVYHLRQRPGKERVLTLQAECTGKIIYPVLFFNL